MVKLSILSIASVAAFASLGAAKNCQTQFNYCSSALLSRGLYSQPSTLSYNMVC